MCLDSWHNTWCYLVSRVNQRVYACFYTALQHRGDAGHCHVDIKSLIFQDARSRCELLFHTITMLSLNGHYLSGIGPS